MAGKEAFMAFPANVGTKADPVLSQQLPINHEPPADVAVAPPPKPAAGPKKLGSRPN